MSNILRKAVLFVAAMSSSFIMAAAIAATQGEACLNDVAAPLVCGTKTGLPFHKTGESYCPKHTRPVGIQVTGNSAKGDCQGCFNDLQVVCAPDEHRRRRNGAHH